MKNIVLRSDPARERMTPEGCFINELSNTENDPGLSIARARVRPGVTTRRHVLRNTAERYVILQGRGRVEIGNLELIDVAAGDVVLIPPMCPQRIANTGSDDLVFLAICSPRFTQENYEDVDETPASPGK